jgi:hypothetical protein
MSGSDTVPKYAWSISLECVVEVIGMGYFPDSLTVRLPNDIVTTVYRQDLQDYDKTRQQ